MLFRCAAGTVAVLFALAGCGSSAPQSEPSSTGSATSTPSAGTTPTPSQGGASPSKPANDGVGTCLGPKPGKPQTKQATPCSGPHELEVAAAFTVKATAFAAGEAEAEQTCRAAVAAYLGSPSYPSTRIRSDAVLPDKASWAKGHRHTSCLVREETPDMRNWVTRRGSLRNILADDEQVHRYRLCGAVKASRADTMRYISCDRPHLAEALPTGVTLGTAADPYPGRQALNRQIGPQCRTALREFLRISGHRTDVVAGWRMSSQKQWATGSRTATCYAEVDSPIRKSLRAIANRPLR